MAKHTIVELEELRNRLREAEETLSAIRNGEVDSLVVSGPQGDQIFSLKGAEQPYRVFVEQMQEGAVTLTSDGTVLYCNRRFAEMVGARMERVIGTEIQSFIRTADQSVFKEALAKPDKRKLNLLLASSSGKLIPAQLSFSRMPMEDDAEMICLVVTDVTEQEERRELAAAMETLARPRNSCSIKTTSWPPPAPPPRPPAKPRTTSSPPFRTSCAPRSRRS